jgi:heme oxygenase (mycobilin-producing)
MSITRVSHFRASEGNAERLMEFLRDQVRPIVIASAGCKGCQILQCTDDAMQFVVIEFWESVDAHKASLAKVPVTMFAAVMPLLGEKPSGFYYHDRSEKVASH